jgi:hypothetical protein
MPGSVRGQITWASMEDIAVNVVPSSSGCACWERWPRLRQIWAVVASRVFPAPKLARPAQP